MAVGNNELEGNVKLNKGDLIRLVTGNGGGWGNPVKPPQENVLADIKNGYIKNI